MTMVDQLNILQEQKPTRKHVCQMFFDRSRWSKINKTALHVQSKRPDLQFQFFLNCVPFMNDNDVGFILEQQYIKTWRHDVSWFYVLWGIHERRQATLSYGLISRSFQDYLFLHSTILYAQDHEGSVQRLLQLEKIHIFEERWVGRISSSDEIENIVARSEFGEQGQS